MIKLCAPMLKSKYGVHCLVANAENAAGGSGLTPVIYRELIEGGVDCITLGDHAFRRREIFDTLAREDNIVRPANYPDTAPGKEIAIVHSAHGHRIAIVCLLGRVFMQPVDCPLQAIDRVLDRLPRDIKIVLVDLHAEATSDKQMISRYLDGRVSAVLGTHTHIPTADETILPNGTAFQADVGMTGPHESIIGRKIDRVVEAARHFRPSHFEVATDDARLNGALVDVDPKTGKASYIERVMITEAMAEKWASEQT